MELGGHDFPCNRHPLFFVKFPIWRLLRHLLPIGLGVVVVGTGHKGLLFCEFVCEVDQLDISYFVLSRRNQQLFHLWRGVAVHAEGLLPHQTLHHIVHGHLGDIEALVQRLAFFTLAKGLGLLVRTLGQVQLVLDLERVGF